MKPLTSLDSLAELITAVSLESPRQLFMGGMFLSVRDGAQRPWEKTDELSIEVRQDSELFLRAR